MAKKSDKIESLEASTAQGLNALNQFSLLQEVFLELKADVMDKFESKDTLETEELQETHRTYRNICSIEKFFISRINRGQNAENKLNLRKEKR